MNVDNLRQRLLDWDGDAGEAWQIMGDAITLAYESVAGRAVLRPEHEQLPDWARALADGNPLYTSEVVAHAQDLLKWEVTHGGDNLRPYTVTDGDL
jgi:hypothetical protein